MRGSRVRRVGSVLAAALAVALTLASCSDDTSEPATAATTTTEPSSEGHGDDHGDGGHGSGPDQAEVPPQTDLAAAPLEGERTGRLEPEIAADGAKVFTLTADVIRWRWIDDEWVTAWGYNRSVPGPEIWVDQGDHVRVELTNHLPVPTTIHWHGVAVPNEMDGIPYVTQDPVLPGESFTYEFDAEPSGTFWYHSHFDSIRQLDMGLSGALIVRGADEPEYDKEFVQLLDEWIRLPDGRNGWEGVAHAGHNFAEYNWFTINGKPFPATEDLVVDAGDRVRIRFINAGYQNHPMHLHGKRFSVVAKDGAPLPQPYAADTVLVGAGERYDIAFTADDPGDWMLHCHVLHHVANDGSEPGGLMTFVRYRGHQNEYQRNGGGRS